MILYPEIVATTNIRLVPNKFYFIKLLFNGSTLHKRSFLGVTLAGFLVQFFNNYFPYKIDGWKRTRILVARKPWDTDTVGGG